jgi:hypothetical protein
MALAGGVLMTIASVLTFIGALYFLLEGLYWMDFWLVLGIVGMAAFSLGIMGAVGVFRRRWRPLVIASLVILIVNSGLAIYDLGMLGIVTFILSIMSLILVAVSWSQFQERAAFGYPMPPFMAPMGHGAPPPYMGPPMGTGAPPPVAAPHPDMGAPPPFAAPHPDMGAPPPAPMVVEDEDEQVSDFIGQ